MGVDRETLRPYDPAQDSSNAVAATASWPKIIIAASSMAITALTALLSVGLFPSDSPASKLIVVGIALLGSVAPAVAFILGESAREKAKVESAARIGEAKVRVNADVAVAQATGQPPAGDVVVAPAATAVSVSPGAAPGVVVPQP